MTTSLVVPTLDAVTEHPGVTIASHDVRDPKSFTVIENVKGQRQYLDTPAYVSDEDIALSENSIKVLEKRYRRDIDGTLLETPWCVLSAWPIMLPKSGRSTMAMLRP
ncbi:MAG: hypothetical protein R2932_19875 [Caldilineaceae bacterium]